MNRQKTFLVIFLLSVVATLGDYFLKRASQQPEPLVCWWFVLGGIAYWSTSFGYVLVMPEVKLGSLAACFSVLTVLMMTILGVLLFEEKLTLNEGVGIVLAVLSLLLLAR